MFRFASQLLPLVLLFVFSGICSANPVTEGELNQALDYLKEAVKAPEGDPDRGGMETLLSYLDGVAPNQKVWETDDEAWGTGVGVSFTINSSLAKLMGYLYNPSIAVEAVIPGVVRSETENRWIGNGDYQAFTSLADSPITVRRDYRMAITPDGNSGAYYTYDQHELTTAGVWQGRRFLLTVSYQPEASDVGRKGYPVATREGGEIYSYSGKKGLTLMGLGWVDSYIYKSIAITLYVEREPGSSSLKGLSFKWLKAGWKGANMVKDYHIENGIVRFAEHLNFFLNQETAPTPQALAEICDRVKLLTTEALKGVFAQQIAIMVDPDEKNADRLGADYIDGMTREDLISGVISNHSVGLLLGTGTVSF